MRAWGSMTAAFRTRTLAFPRAMAAEVTRAAAGGPAAVEAVLMRGARDLLTTLAGWEPPTADMTPRTQETP